MNHFSVLCATRVNFAGASFTRKHVKRAFQSIFLEALPEDEDIDFQKPLAFTDIWHNKNDFVVVFTKDHVKVKRCKSCKVEFARGGVVCIPHVIAVLHMERYLYPKKDGMESCCAWNQHGAKKQNDSTAPTRSVLLSATPTFGREC